MEISANELVKKWTFPWLAIDVMIGGKSSIDLNELRIQSYDDAKLFLSSYGYDWEDQKDQRLLGAVLIESKNFILQHLATNSLVMPEEILLCDDVCRLLELTSPIGTQNSHLKAWACAVLRVAHTIAHIEGAHQHIKIEEASRQIRASFSEKIQSDQDGTLWLGEIGTGIELERVEWKMMKSRESIILKLLHKAGNVAETIFDLIGVRVVTKRLSDVLLVIAYLRELHLISMPNCHPSRSRNNLVDVNRFRSNLEMLTDMLKTGRLSPNEFPKLLERLTQGGDVANFNVNPHSGINYRAIQLTSRQLIRYPNPTFRWICMMENYLKQHQNAQSNLFSMLDFIKRQPGFSQEQEISAFFPFEVQVMDKDAYQANQYGDASHDRYKQAQVRTARRRVLSEVLKL